MTKGTLKAKKLHCHHWGCRQAGRKSCSGRKKKKLFQKYQALLVLQLLLSYSHSIVRLKFLFWGLKRETSEPVKRN